MAYDFRITLALLALDGMKLRPDCPCPDCGCPAQSSSHTSSSNRVFYSKLGNNWYIIPCNKHLQFYIDHHREVEL
jgi:hypothetical protein